jgi:hypothetical protein
MTDEELHEWEDAVHGLHRWCNWFIDVRGSMFSFLWYSTLRGDK